MERFTEIILSKLAEKQLVKLPISIQDKFYTWMATVLKIGIYETRKQTGYHDEPLKGQRKGQRSVRLNRSYRAIYKINETGDLILITILEVNNHEY